MADYREIKEFHGAQSELKTPVLLIFFNRYEQFIQVFNAVKKVKPSELFLYQDGPRFGKNDEEGIEECRSVIELIDWECKVHFWFREKNCGCDPSEYLAQKWAFSFVEKCIVLEDDDVPSKSFFFFCQDMLNKYENDERFNIISGMNYLGEYCNSDADYFFTTICSIWGWASWKRVVDEWDDMYEFLDDEYVLNNLSKTKKLTNIDQVIGASKRHRNENKAFYETILASQMFLTHRLNIVPKVNLISNVGIAPTSTHATDAIEKLPKGIQPLFNMETYEMEFPLKSPKYVIEDFYYQKCVKRMLGWGHPIIGLYRGIESKIRKIIWNVKRRKN